MEKLRNGIINSKKRIHIEVTIKVEEIVNDQGYQEHKYE